jgi:hypothetical protein
VLGEETHSWSQVSNEALDDSPAVGNRAVTLQHVLTLRKGHTCRGWEFEKRVEGRLLC